MATILYIYRPYCVDTMELYAICVQFLATLHAKFRHNYNDTEKNIAIYELSIVINWQ